MIVQSFARVQGGASAGTLRALEAAGLPVAKAPYRLNDLIRTVTEAEQVLNALADEQFGAAPAWLSGLNDGAQARSTSHTAIG